MVEIRGQALVLGIARDITKRKRAEEALQQRNRELSTLNTIAQAVGQSMRLGTVLQAALDSVLQTVELDTGAVYLLDEAAGKLVSTTYKGIRELPEAVCELPLGVGLAGKAVQEGRVLFVADVSEKKWVIPDVNLIIESERIQSLVAIPLKSKGRSLGVIIVASRTPRDSSDEEVRLLETIGNQIGVAVENAQLLEEMSRLSMTDELTGLYNRCHFYEVLETEGQFAQRHGGSFSVSMLDIDGFKAYNDRFGHINGDAVLKTLADVLKSALRKSDTAFRYGGDEFAIISPAADAGKTRKMVQRIVSKWTSKLRQLSEAQDFVRESRLGLSAGIAQFPENAGTADDLVFLADTALYHSKRWKRNTCILVSELGTIPPDGVGLATPDEMYALAAAVDAKDRYTYGHSKRVMLVSEMIGKAIGLPPQQLADLCAAALLHDVGKAGIPDKILAKHVKPTKAEWRLIKKHCVEGAKIVGRVKELRALVPMILYHHEWSDGTGYPAGLKGQDIPLGARILCIADAYETMTTPRHYREAMSQEQALEELTLRSGTQFDPELVEAMCRGTNEASSMDSCPEYV